MNFSLICVMDIDPFCSEMLIQKRLKASIREIVSSLYKETDRVLSLCYYRGVEQFHRKEHDSSLIIQIRED